MWLISCNLLSDPWESWGPDIKAKPVMLSLPYGLLSMLSPVLHTVISDNIKENTWWQALAFFGDEWCRNDMLPQNHHNFGHFNHICLSCKSLPLEFGSPVSSWWERQSLYSFWLPQLNWLFQEKKQLEPDKRERKDAVGSESMLFARYILQAM